MVPEAVPAHRVHSSGSMSTISSEKEESGSSSSSTPKQGEEFSMLNTMLSSYECGKILGKGSSGHVFEVTHKTSGEKFACKVIHKNFMMNDDRTMNTEVEIMKHVRHENIANMHELYETSASKWFILELANAGTLHTALATESNYTEGLIAAQFKQVLQGVQYLHSMGIVHRDLKQDNILCSVSVSAATGEKSYTVKIADFGLSAVVAVRPNKNHSRETLAMKKLKLLREMWGTTEYFAPEVYQRAYGPQVDVWALGCVLYELLTGESPFPVRERTVSSVEKYLLNGGAKVKRYFELQPAWFELSFEAQDLIRNMLKVNPTRRLSVEECLAHPWITGVVETVDNRRTRSRSSSGAAALQIATDLQKYAKKLAIAQAAAVKRAQSKLQRHKVLAGDLEKIKVTI